MPECEGQDADVDHVVVGVLVVRLHGREQERLRGVGGDVVGEELGDLSGLLHVARLAREHPRRRFPQELQTQRVAAQQLGHLGSGPGRGSAHRSR